LDEQPRLAMGHMEVRIDFEARDASDQLTHLYNFRQGRSVQSFGAM
jgi:DNA mismatch repair protein MSH5